MIVIAVFGTRCWFDLSEVVIRINCCIDTVSTKLVSHVSSFSSDYLLLRDSLSHLNVIKPG